MKNQKKDLEFRGDTLEIVRCLPAEPKRDIGYQLDRLQHGYQPDNWKPMKIVGPGVNEVRVACIDGAFRVFYVVRPEAIYVLHVFRKTTQKTEKRDIDLAISRFKDLGSN